MAILNYQPRVSARIKQASLLSAKEFSQILSTETIQILMQMIASSEAAVLTLRSLLKMLPNLPPDPLKNLILLMEEMDLQPMKVQRIKKYLPPCSSYVYGYRAAYDSRGMIADIKIFDEIPILL